MRTKQKLLEIQLNQWKNYLSTVVKKSVYEPTPSTIKLKRRSAIKTEDELQQIKDIIEKLTVDNISENRLIIKELMHHYPLINNYFTINPLDQTSLLAAEIYGKSVQEIKQKEAFKKQVVELFSEGLGVEKESSAVGLRKRTGRGK